MKTWVVHERERLCVAGTASGLENADAIPAAAAENLWSINDKRGNFCSRDFSGALLLQQYCGVLAIPGGSLEILPKITNGNDESTRTLARRALLTLLADAPELNFFERRQVAQADCKTPLLDLFIATFLREAILQAKLGLIEVAIAHEENVGTLRGRFLPIPHLRVNAMRPDRLYCRYDELTVDNPLNRYVLGAIECCRTMITGSATSALWMETRARFDRVRPDRASQMRAAPGTSTRSSFRYRRLLAWAERILSLSSPSMTAGGAAAPELLYDMQKLFEHAVYRRCVAEAGPDECVVRPRANLPLARHSSSSQHFGLRPDVVISHAPSGRLVRIVDAKWKWLEPGKANRGIVGADIHQVVTYALRYDCKNVRLVYPTTEPRQRESSEIFEVIREGVEASLSSPITITVKTLSIVG